MNSLILILIGIVLFFLFIENIKHHFIIKSRKILVLAILLILILLIASGYFDFSQVFKKDNPVATTGASIVNTAKENFKDIEILDVSLLDSVDNKIKGYFSKITKNLE